MAGPAWCLLGKAKTGGLGGYPWDILQDEKLLERRVLVEILDGIDVTYAQAQQSQT